MDFKISRSNRQCASCSRRFEAGETFVVGLMARPKEDGVFDRVDICLACWERQGAGSFAAHWLSEFNTEKKPVLFDPDFLWQVFHKVRPGSAMAPTGADGKPFSPQELARFAYVAALGLVRLKQLKQKSTRRSKQGEMLVLETSGKRAKDKQVFEVPNPELDEQGVQDVQDRLAELA